MASAMRTFRFTDNDIQRLDRVAKKYIEISEKEGIRGITKNTVLRSLILLGESSPTKEVIEKIKQLKIYG
jgi:hypothetical protein